MLENELQNLGLSDKEARVYLASLRLGRSTVQEIANQADVNRGTCYNVIEYLMKKGLMSTYTQGKKTFFTAESPERLRSLIRLEEQELRDKDVRFSKYLPDLLSLYSSGDNKPKVKYFEGWEGLKSIMEEFLKCKSKRIDNVVNLDAVDYVLPSVVSDYTPRRVAKGIQSRFLYTTAKGPNEDLKKTDKQQLRESRYIQLDKFPFEADITIFDDKISLESYTKERILGILIEDKKIANSIKCMFEFIWNQAGDKEQK